MKTFEEYIMERNSSDESWEEILKSKQQKQRQLKKEPEKKMFVASDGSKFERESSRDNWEKILKKQKERKLKEGYYTVPPIDTERYAPITGLEGPINTVSGKVLYYDPKEGKYYDRDTDMYVSDEEYFAYNQSNVKPFNSPLDDPNSKEHQYMKRKGFK